MKHVTIVAVLQIGYGIVYLLGSLATFFGIGGVMAMMDGISDHSSVVTGGSIGQMVTGFMMLSVLGSVLLSVSAIIDGWGVYRGREWARIVVLIVGVLELIEIPRGTVLGIYTLMVLFSDPQPPTLPNQGGSKK
jgi:hypothetical protein